MTPSPHDAGALADLPQPETMLTYASILEKQQYVVKNNAKYPIATGEIVEAACAALRVCAALRSPVLPAGSGVLQENIAKIIHEKYLASDNQPFWNWAADEILFRALVLPKAGEVEEPCTHPDYSAWDGSQPEPRPASPVPQGEDKP